MWFEISSQKRLTWIWDVWPEYITHSHWLFRIFGISIAENFCLFGYVSDLFLFTSHTGPLILRTQLFFDKIKIAELPNTLKSLIFEQTVCDYEKYSLDSRLLDIIRKNFRSFDAFWIFPYWRSSCSFIDLLVELMHNAHRGKK